MAAAASFHGIPAAHRLAPFNPTSGDAVATALKLLRLKSTDTFLDIGCGDGRVLIEAATNFRCACAGIECDMELIARGRAAAEAQRLPVLGGGVPTDSESSTVPSVTIVHGDGLEYDWTDITGTPPTAIFCYLKPEGLKAIQPKLRVAVEAGARLVTHMFSVKGWTPKKVIPCGVISVRLYDASSLPEEASSEAEAEPPAGSATEGASAPAVAAGESPAQRVPGPAPGDPSDSLPEGREAEGSSESPVEPSVGPT